MRQLIWQRGLCRQDYVKAFEMEDHLGLSRWSSVVTRVLGNEAGNRRGRLQMRAPQEDAMLQALREEEGTRSQEMQVASPSRKDGPP